MKNRNRFLALGTSSLVASLLVAAVTPGCMGDPAERSEFGPEIIELPAHPAPPGPLLDQDPDASSNDGATGPGTKSCASATAEARRVPVYMQFIIDGSGSMDGFDGTNFIAGEREADPASPGRQTGKKWIAVRDALGAFFDDLAAKADPSFAVGMYLFSSNTTKPATGVDVPIQFVDAAQATALKTRVAPPVFATGATPLAASINGQLDVLRAYTPAAPVASGGKYVLVVMTDGIPSDGKTACTNAIAAAKTGSPEVTTFAVGVGNEDASASTVYDEAFMRDLAVAGGTAVAGCNTSWGHADKSGVPCHFQITPGTKTAAQIRAEFLAAINTIRDTVASCELELVKPDGAGDLDPSNVDVIKSSGGVDTSIPQGPTNGWSYDNPAAPTKVLLNGAACADFKADTAATIKIVIGCKGSGPK